MMPDKERYVIGIDTSNYTTSVAVTDGNGTVIRDERRMLSVRPGERGLRQQEALFQHIDNVPDLLEKALKDIDRKSICLAACSERPRPVEGSYMPVFKAGINAARNLAAALDIPYKGFSHQEGHVEAARHNGPLADADKFLCWHLSGGTCELLRVRCVEGLPSDIEIIGGTKDISFGQLLDRIGVALGFPFPCGKELDMMASEASRDKAENAVLTKIKCCDNGSFFNVTGTETQMLRYIEEGGYGADNMIPNEAVYELFSVISDCLYRATAAASERTGIKDVLFSGGVSSSATVKKMLDETLRKNSGDIMIHFGEPALSSDNAVGISLLGGKIIWQ